MNDATINIRIVQPDDEIGTPASPSTPDVTADTPNAPEKKKGGIRKIAGVNFAIGIAKQGVQLGASQVGFITGSSYAQSQVNAGIKAVGIATMMAVNPLVGLTALTVDIVGNVIQHNQKKWEEELRIGRIMGRSGSEYNRSRG